MEIVRNTDQNRFELHHEGVTVGTLEYSYDGDATVLEHIEVAEQYSGQGLAARLTESVLGELGRNEQAVIPTCPYVRGYIIKHPQWRGLLPPGVELRA